MVARLDRRSWHRAPWLHACPASLALLAGAGPPAVAPEVVEVQDLATLKPTDITCLAGKRALYRVVIDTSLASPLS